MSAKTSSRRFVRRPYEKVALVAVRTERVMCLFWARRCRKSTILGSVAFDEMSKEPGRSVISASASLLLGTELVNMTVTAAEQAILVTNEAAAVNAIFEQGSAQHKLDYRLANAETGQIYTGASRKDFADLYSSKRLEMRLYHDRTAYSRQLVIAPNPATARGWRGTVLRDEAAFTSATLELALREAVDPIFRDVPDLKMIYASNLGRDDRHPFFEMTLPAADAEFPVNDKGNFYRGQDGLLVHRVTLRDAYEAGHTLYDNKGVAMSYAEFAAQPGNRAQMPYNYDLEHVMGGSAAIDLLALMVGQQRGAQSGCAFAYIEDDADFQRALDVLRVNLRDGAVAIGYDPATTTRQTSNPSGITVTEMSGGSRAQRLVMCWKSSQPAVVIERLRQLCEVIRAREAGSLRRLVIAATSERYFATMLSDALAGTVPVQLLIESETLRPAGYDRPVNYKTFLGDIYAAAVNDNRYDLPPGDYFKRDQRQTLKSGGRYECPVDAATGAHGDTFTSGSLAEYALAHEQADYSATLI